MNRFIPSILLAGFLSLPLGAWGQAPAGSGPTSGTELSDTFAADLALVRTQIAEAERDLASAPGGLLGDLTRVRIGVYRLTEALLEHRAAVAATGVTVPGVLSAADPARVARAEAEVAAARERVAAAMAQASQSGGMIGILALTTLATERQALALAELAAVSARQGFALAPPATGGATAGQPTESSPASDVPGTADTNDRAPDAPRSRAFSVADRRGLQSLGYSVEDDWAFRSSRSRMDDTPEAHGQTLATEDFDTSRDARALLVACIEGETRLYIDVQKYLLTDYQRRTVRVTYRMDQRPPITVNWGTSTSGRATGLWGRDAIPLIRALLDGDELLLRVVEQNNQQHQMTFSLKGFRNAAQAVAEACRWSLQPPTPASGQQPRPAGAQRR
jgi:hypothetical protein